MFLRISILEWKSFFRSASLGKSIALKLFMGFMILYFGVSLLIVGFALAEILADEFPEVSPLHVVNKYLIYWWIGEAIMRFVFQSLPVLQVKPFLFQPVKKNTLIHFILFKSLFHWANGLSILLFGPFAAMLVIEGWQTTSEMLVWLISVIGVSISLNFLNFLLQKKWMEQPKYLILLLLVIAIMVGLDYFGVYSAAALIGQAFDAIVKQPFLAVIPVLLPVWGYIANRQFLRKQLYLDQVVRDQSIGYKDANFGWTSRFGSLAPYLQMDLMLLQRNKRTRSMVMMSVVFLLYGLIFYPNPQFEGSSMLVMIGIILSGMFLINFGQFVPSWDGSYFSLYMTQKMPLRSYLEAKALLMTLSVLILTLLSLPYMYFGWHILWINLCCAVYNIGVNIPVVLYMGSFNKKKVDLDKAQFFNYQGTGMTQWIVGIPLFLVPIILFALTKLFASQQTACLLLLALGVVGILVQRPIMRAIVQAYQHNKYERLEGFKQQD
jgi:hypothetical protein